VPNDPLANSNAQYLRSMGVDPGVLGQPVNTERTRTHGVKVLLVDGNNLLIRAVKATETVEMSADGINTAPLVVFVNTLTHHVREEQPDKLVVAWDSPHGSEYRLNIDPQYKANRVEHEDDWEERKGNAFALAKEFLALANVLSAARPGVEADDIIAAYWQQYRNTAHVVILSSDKDFMQLLTDGTEQVRVSSGGAPTDRWDEQRVVDERGYHPRDIGKIMALVGDKGDNVPGIAGIGPKTAVKILQEADWDLDKVVHKKITDIAEVHTNYSLVDLRAARALDEVGLLPLFSPTAPGDALARDLVGFFETYRLAKIESRWLTATLWR
jgi:5'-3' exonuclease